MAEAGGLFYNELELDPGPLEDGLSRSEKAYKRFQKGWGSFVGKLEGGWKRFTGGLKRASTRFRRPKEEVGGDKKDGFFKKALAREKGALGDLGISGGGLAGLIGGGAIIGLIGKSISSFLEYDKVIRSLDSSLSALPGTLNAAAGAINDMNGYLDMTREELAQIASGIAQLHILEKNTKENARAFRALMKDTIHLAKSLDTSTASVVDLWRSFTKVYGLPHNRLKNIAAAMKFVQEKTGIAGDELVAFGKTLDDVLARMSTLSGDAKAKVTADLMAMAGQFKKIGIEPERISGIFGAALKIDSAEGQDWLAYITENTQYSLDQMREMIKKGDVQTPMKLWMDRLKKESPEALEYQEERFKTMTGMTIGELSRLRNLSEKEMSELFKGTEGAYQKGKLHAKRAGELQNPLVQKWNAVKNMFAKLWNTIGAGFLGVVAKLASVAIPIITKVVGKLQGWVDWLSSTEGGTAINNWFMNLKSAAETAWTWIVDKAKWVSDAIKGLVAWWGSLTDTEKSLLKWGAIVAGVFATFGGALGALGGKITAIVAGLTAIYVGAKKIADWVDQEQTKQIKAEGAAKATTHAIAGALGGGEQQRFGFVKAEMMTKEGGLITAGGEINEAELMRRASALIPTPMGWDLMPDVMKRKLVLEPRANLVGVWKAGLQNVLSKTDIKKVNASIERQRAEFKAAAPPATAAPAEAKPPPVATVAPPTAGAIAPAAAPAPAQPQVTVVTTPKTESLLQGILDTLTKIANRGVRGTHPARTALEGETGG